MVAPKQQAPSPDPEAIEALKARVTEELELLASAPDPADYVEIGPDGVSRLRPEVKKNMRAVRSFEISPRGVKVELYNREAAR